MVDQGEVGYHTLEKELQATPVAELAKIAQQHGNAERGKTVFYKSAAACFACHDPPAGTVRLGPDLAKLKTSLTPEELVESLIDPSKRIEDDYKQLTVLTVEGKVFTGLRISETDDELVLRNFAKPEPIKIKN